MSNIKIKPLKLITLGVVSFTFLSVIALLAFIATSKPELNTIKNYSKVIVDNNQQLLRIELSSDDYYRVYTPLSSINTDFIHATLLYEDQHYYQHYGVELKAIIRAAWQSYIIKQRKIGASTITMQVARLYWSLDSKNIIGKLQQIIRALQLNWHYDKKTILELYFNLAPYGGNIEGIGAASLIYFNKPASQLNLSEALTLAVVPQNPNKRNPATTEGSKKLNVAKVDLLKRWRTSQYYQAQSDNDSIGTMPLAVRSVKQLPYHAPHFVRKITQLTPPWQGGYFHTGLDLNKQQQLEKITRHYLASNKNKQFNNAAALVLNYKTLQIEAMLGSADFYNEKIHGQVNGVLAKRSPGSTLKPFVYALAMDEGLIHPESLLKDLPRKFGGFSPENYDKQFIGPIRAKQALIKSRNVPAVVLQSQLKKQRFYPFLKKSGVKGLREENFYGLALALGGAEISMLELAQLYAMLANNGQFSPAKFLYQEPSSEKKSLLSPESSYLILDMLKDNPMIGSKSHHNKHYHIPWKTGTSWAFRDAWAIGISGDYVVAVWLGNFDGSSNSHFIGQTAAGPLLFKIFNQLLPDNHWKVYDTIATKHLNIKAVNICSKTGDIDNQLCKSTIKGKIIPGVSPIKDSNIYRKIMVDKTTGLRSCKYVEGKTQWQIYEFWPSDYLQLFNKAGIHLINPPRFSQECLHAKNYYSTKVNITSPQSYTTYITNQSTKGNLIPLIAETDSHAKNLHWFINNSYIGHSNREKNLQWLAKPGKHLVRVVDNLGSSDSLWFTVK